MKQLKIGVTGGIGSGKTYVCKQLEQLGFPVYYSDAASKELTNTNPEIRKELIQLFGEEVYTESGLNKPFLASKIFSDEQLRINVNAIIHPIVRADFANWAAEQTNSLVFNEAAILIETGGYKELDALILVVADEEERIERTMKRDHASREEVLARMAKQWSDAAKVPYADFVIYNDSKHDLLEQIENIICQLKERIG